MEIYSREKFLKGQENDKIDRKSAEKKEKMMMMKEKNKKKRSRLSGLCLHNTSVSHHRDIAKMWTRGEDKPPK